MLLKFLIRWYLQRKLVNDWKASQIRVDDFLAKNDWLHQVNLGASFSVEELLHQLGFTPNLEEIKEQLVYFVKDVLHLQTIRFALPWNRIVNEKGKIELSYYGAFLDTFLQNDLKICVNVGPIKCLRWPEDHVPQYVLDKLSKIPEQGATISKNEELGKYAQEHLQNLLLVLKERYADSMMLQLENEASQVHFGEHEWALSKDYLLSVLDIAYKIFPQSTLMLNYPSPLKSVAETHSVLLSFKKSHPDAQLTAMLNYYWKHPKARKFVKGEYEHDSYLAMQTERYNFWKNSVINLNKHGINFDGISEFQLEPWGGYSDLPGNSLSGTIFSLIRSRNFLLPAMDPFNVWIWGLEFLFHRYKSKALTSEQQEILHLIAKIN